jgi:hypothetical protein
MQRLSPEIITKSFNWENMHEALMVLANAASPADPCNNTGRSSLVARSWFWASVVCKKV